MTRRGSAPFLAVVGLLCGVLVVALAAPDHAGDGGGSLETSGGSAEVATEAGTGSVEGSTGAGDAGPGAVGAATPAAGAGGGGGGGGGAASPRSSGGAVPSAGAGSAGGTGGATGAASGGAAPAAAAAAAPATGPVRGVSGDTIKIGVGILNLGALKSLGPAFDNGDRKAHFESILDGWRKAGVVPVHGRNIQFVYREYGVLSPEERRSACLALIQDEKAFALLGDSQFTVGIECVAREYKTPLVTSDSETDDVFARTAPNFFSTQMSLSRLLRNMVHWGDRRGLLKGKRIGIYYLNDAPSRNVVENAIKPELRKLRHTIAAEATTDQSLGGPGDTLAVQKFQTERVDVAILLTSKAGFMQQANAQRYRPTYIESDLLSGTTNTAASTYPADHFDGTFGMTGLRLGEWKAGLPVPAEAKTCAGNYQRTSGKAVEANAREAEWVALNKACDAANSLLAGLQKAGRNLTPQSLVAGMEQVRGLKGGIHPDINFGPGKHHGVDFQRTVQFSAACKCWKALGAFSPVFVP